MDHVPQVAAVLADNYNSTAVMETYTEFDHCKAVEFMIKGG